jgi:hypothetical protein
MIAPRVRSEDNFAIVSAPASSRGSCPYLLTITDERMPRVAKDCSRLSTNGCSALQGIDPSPACLPSGRPACRSAPGPRPGCGSWAGARHGCNIRVSDSSAEGVRGCPSRWFRKPRRMERPRSRAPWPLTAIFRRAAWVRLDPDHGNRRGRGSHLPVRRAHKKAVDVSDGSRSTSTIMGVRGP